MLEVPKRTKRKATETPAQPGRKKPGPKPFVATDAQRELVTLAVSIGMTIADISDAIAVPKRSLWRHFLHELAVGRAQRVLANAARLDKAAAEGNVAAMKALHVLMDRDVKPETAADDDPWAAVAAEIEAETGNLARNREFSGKAN